MGFSKLRFNLYIYHDRLTPPPEKRFRRCKKATFVTYNSSLVKQTNMVNDSMTMGEKHIIPTKNIHDIWVFSEKYLSQPNLVT